MILHRITMIRQRIHSTNSSKNWRNKTNRNVQLITRKNAIRVEVRGRRYSINAKRLYCIISPKTCDCKRSRDHAGHNRSR